MGTDFGKFFVEIQTFSFKKMHLNMSSGKWWPFCLSLNVLTCVFGHGWFFCIVQGWGLLRQFPPFRYFANFSALSKQTLAIEYPVYIWQVSPQLSCGDTCQIWTWCEESNMYFCHIENFAYGEINERSFSNPHPRTASLELGLSFKYQGSHHNDVIMSAMASQITSLTIVCSAVYSGADQRKHQRSASLALWREFTGDRWIPRTNGQ